MFSGQRFGFCRTRIQALNSSLLLTEESLITTRIGHTRNVHHLFDREPKLSFLGHQHQLVLCAHTVTASLCACGKRAVIHKIAAV